MQVNLLYVKYLDKWTYKLARKSPDHSSENYGRIRTERCIL